MTESGDRTTNRVGRVWQVASSSPPDTRRCRDVESTSLTVIQRRNNVVCPLGRLDDLTGIYL